MKIKITDRIGYLWAKTFVGKIFEVLDGEIIEGHHQWPVMTQFGRTWFDKDKVEILDETSEEA